MQQNDSLHDIDFAQVEPNDQPPKSPPLYRNIPIVQISPTSPKSGIFSTSTSSVDQSSLPAQPHKPQSDQPQVRKSAPSSISSISVEASLPAVQFITPHQDQQIAPTSEESAGILKQFGSQLKSIAKDAKEVIVDNSQSGKSVIAKWMSGSKSANQIDSMLTPEPLIFGRPLSEIPLDDGVPVVMRKCIDFLSKTCLDLVGLFRVPGSQTEIKRIRDMFDRGLEVDFYDLDLVKTPHTVAALLKLFLRELPEPLVTFEYYYLFLAANSTPDQPTQLESLRKLLRHIPATHLCSLIFLLKFLLLVRAHSEENKMTTQNLAIVFGPNLLRDKDEEPASFSDTGSASQIVVTLLDHYDFLLDGLDWGTLVEQINAEISVSQLDLARQTDAPTATREDGQQQQSTNLASSFVEQQQRMVSSIGSSFKKLNSKIKDTLAPRKTSEPLPHEDSPSKLETVPSSGGSSSFKLTGPRLNPFQEKKFVTSIERGIADDTILLGKVSERDLANRDA